MSVEQTLSIIKPDAVAKNVTGQINARFEAAGLQIVAQKMLRLSDDVCFSSKIRWMSCMICRLNLSHY